MMSFFFGSWVNRLVLKISESKNGFKLVMLIWRAYDEFNIEWLALMIYHWNKLRFKNKIIKIGKWEWQNSIDLYQTDHNEKGINETQHVTRSTRSDSRISTVSGSVSKRLRK